MLAQIIRVQRAVEAPGREDVLAVAVPVDVQLDSRGVAEGVDERREALILGRVVGCFAPVHGRARVGACAQRVAVPFVAPVAVDVAPDARLVRRRWRRRLSVLTP